MEYQFPRIATSNSINQQVWKMREEMLEIEAEWSELLARSMRGEQVDYTDLAIEGLDLWQTIETFLQLLPFSKHDIDMLHNGVIQKNSRRGYYEEGK